MSGTVVASSWWIAQADPTPVDFEGLVDDSLGSADWIRAGAIVLGSIVVAPSSQGACDAGAATALNELITLQTSGRYDGCRLPTTGTSTGTGA